MRRKHAVCAILSIIIIFALVALTNAAKPNFPYLIDAVNDISKIDHSKPDLSDADAVMIAKIACDTMNRVVKDPEFLSLTHRYMDKDFLRNNPSARDLLNDLGQFNDEFRRMESEQLGKAGLTQEAINDALSSAGSSRGSLDTKHITGQTIQHDSKVLQLEACKLRDQLETNYRTAAEMYKIKLLGVGIFGLALIAVDVSAGGGSAGALTPVATVSIYFGGAVVQGAVQDLLSVSDKYK